MLNYTILHHSRMCLLHIQHKLIYREREREKTAHTKKSDNTQRGRANVVVQWSPHSLVGKRSGNASDQNASIIGTVMK